MDILNLIANGLTGGLAGLLGSAISSYTKYKMTKLQMEHEKEMIKIQMESMKLEKELAIATQKVISETEIAKAEMSSLQASYEELKKTFFDSRLLEGTPVWLKSFISLILVLVDALRATVRPIITYLLCGIFIWILLNSDPLRLIDNSDRLVATSIFLTVSIVTWWFSDRNIEKFITKLYERK